jgi:hypothetical protein
MIIKKLNGGMKVAAAVRISEKLVKEAKKYSHVDHRSITGQIEHWARIGKCAELLTSPALGDSLCSSANLYSISADMQYLGSLQ